MTKKIAEFELWITDEEREALEASIAEWEKEVAVPRSRGICPLCIISTCIGDATRQPRCLISVWEDGGGCGDTPYAKFVGAQRGSHERELGAKMELNYLKDLLKNSRHLVE